MENAEILELCAQFACCGSNENRGSKIQLWTKQLKIVC